MTAVVVMWQNKTRNVMTEGRHTPLYGVVGGLSGRVAGEEDCIQVVAPEVSDGHSKCFGVSEIFI